MAVNNDKEFKAALAALPLAESRLLAARFVERVLDLCADRRVRAAVAVAARPELSEDERVAAFQSANTARVESYSPCGHETDWADQSGHFVARAAAACLAIEPAGMSPAWEAAMQARMARTFHTIATGDGTDNDEAQAQYALLGAFLDSTLNQR